jgi:hypothetical protein
LFFDKSKDFFHYLLWQKKLPQRHLILLGQILFNIIKAKKIKVMKKLKIDPSQLRNAKILSREELKKVMGGEAPPDGGDTGGCVWINDATSAPISLN